MGWPLVRATAKDGSGRKASLLRALLALAGGHLLAMAGMLLPFAFMTILVQWQRDIRLGAVLCSLVGAGIYLLVKPAASALPGRRTAWDN